MSIKEYAIDILNTMPDEKIMAFITLFADENAIARMETEMAAANTDRKRYDSFDEIAKEIESE